MDISAKDQQLLAILTDNARCPVSEIARQMSVSRTAAQMRLQKLERNGVIEGYGVRYSPAYRKNQVRALVMIKSPARNRSEIEKALSQIPQLTALYSISGVFDLSAIISAGSVVELDQIIDAIGQMDGVLDTMSSVILSTKIDR